MERLKQAQSSVLKTQNKTVENIEKIISDYENLKKNLINLNRCLEKPAFIPFSQPANTVDFSPYDIESLNEFSVSGRTYNSNQTAKPKCLLKGKLKHTNELLILLGSKYFAETTTHQATKIIDHRVDIFSKIKQDYLHSNQQVTEHQNFTHKFQQEETTTAAGEVGEFQIQRSENLDLENGKFQVVAEQKTASSTAKARPEFSDVGSESDSDLEDDLKVKVTQNSSSINKPEPVPEPFKFDQENEISETEKILYQQRLTGRRISKQDVANAVQELEAKKQRIKDELDKFESVEKLMDIEELAGENLSDELTAGSESEGESADEILLENIKSELENEVSIHEPVKIAVNFKENQPGLTERRGSESESAPISPRDLHQRPAVKKSVKFGQDQVKIIPNKEAMVEVTVNSDRRTPLPKAELTGIKEKVMERDVFSLEKNQGQNLETKPKRVSRFRQNLNR